MIDEHAIGERYRALAGELDERRRAGGTRRGGREARVPELLTALRRDPVGRPGVVEHDLDLVWHLSQYVHFMAEGRVQLQGPPSEVRAHATVIEKYLGGAGSDDANGIAVDHESTSGEHNGLE